MIIIILLANIGEQLIKGCNSSCKKTKILPVLFHNLQGYDSHLFTKEIGEIEGKLECIPSTEEKYLTFSKK